MSDIKTRLQDIVSRRYVVIVTSPLCTPLIVDIVTVEHQYTVIKTSCGTLQSPVDTGT